MPEITIPDSPDALEEMLNDDKVLADLLANNQFGDFTRAYVRNVNRRDPGISDQVTELAQAALKQMLADNGIDPADRPDLKGANPYAKADPRLRARGLYNPDAVGAAKDDLFATSGEYFHAIWRNNPAKNSPEMAKKLDSLRNWASDVPADGGYLIPERLRSELLAVALETAIVRPRAFVVPMDSLRVPFPTVDDSTHASSVFGGITAYWTEEGGTLTESQARFGRVVLDAKKLTIYAKLPSELISDSVVSLTGFIDQKFPEAIAYFEDVAFIDGSGVGEPLGYQNANAVVTVTENTANNVKFADVTAMYARMLPASLGRAVWVASIDTFPQLAAMELSSGSPAVWINNGIAGAPPMTILGRPVIFTEKVPALGTTGALSFVDFGFYLIGDRQAMQARQSEHVAFDTDEVAFRVIERVDGRPWLQSAITPRNGGNTLSPFVSLLSA